MSSSKTTLAVIARIVALAIFIAGIATFLFFLSDMEFQRYVRELPLLNLMSARSQFLFWFVLTFGIPGWIILWNEPTGHSAVSADEPSQPKTEDDLKADSERRWRKRAGIGALITIVMLFWLMFMGSKGVF